MERRFEVTIRGWVDDQLEDEHFPLTKEEVETIIKDSISLDLTPGVKLEDEAPEIRVIY